MQASMLTAANRGVGRYGWLLGLGLGAIVAGLVLTRPAALAPRANRKQAAESIFVGLSGQAERRLALLAVERSRQPTDANSTVLAAACDDFVRGFPDHAHAFNYAVRAQDLRGTRDLAALQAILVRASDRHSAQFANNTISFATLLTEGGRAIEALACYEEALAMPECPMDRRGEACLMVAMILRGSDEVERTRSALQEVRRHTERFPVVEAELRLLDLEAGNIPAQKESPVGGLISADSEMNGSPVANDAAASNPIGQVIFQDHVVLDRAHIVKLLAETCYSEGTIELSVGQNGPGFMNTAFSAKWPPSGSRRVTGPASLSMGAIVYQGGDVYEPSHLDSIDEAALCRSTRRGWSPSRLRALPLVESGAIEDGCDGE